MKPAELLLRLRRGDRANVRFADFEGLLRAFGFHLERTTGSHHIYRHANSPVRLNLQPVRGEVKPYQVQQFLKIVERYGLQFDQDDQGD